MMIKWKLRYWILGLVTLGALLIFQNCSRGFESAPPQKNQTDTSSQLGEDIHPLYATKFGILYSTWHCPASRHPVSIAKVNAGLAHWLPVPSFHWWDQPADGYYCLSENRPLLKKHAELLRDAGIDFIVLDVTNWTTVDESNNPDSMIVRPVKVLYEEWATVTGAPKIVPWTPLVDNGTMYNFLRTQILTYPMSQFLFEGKPLFLTTPHVTSNAQVASAERAFTVRKMWGLFSDSQSAWSFLSPCADQKSFRGLQGKRECDQAVYFRNGQAEELSVSAAYQETYMSNRITATPKFGGETLLRQFDRVLDYPDVKIVLITSWNEWIAQRSDGNNFVDNYDPEYSRDVEPSAIYGNHMYLLMKGAISALKQGRKPSQTLSRRTSYCGFPLGAEINRCY